MKLGGINTFGFCKETLDDVLDAMTEDEKKNKGPKYGDGRKNQKLNLKFAFRQLRGKNIDPDKTAAIVDIQCSLRFNRSTVETVPCITRSRGAQTHDCKDFRLVDEALRSGMSETSLGQSAMQFI